MKAIVKAADKNIVLESISMYEYSSWSNKFSFIIPTDQSKVLFNLLDSGCIDYLKKGEKNGVTGYMVSFEESNIVKLENIDERTIFTND